jgi:hypothetical protein
MPIYSSVAWCLEMGAVLSPHSEKYAPLYSVNLYNVWIAPMSIYSSVAWCLEMGAVLPPHSEKTAIISYI